MVLETFKLTLKHDTGFFKVKLTSLSGEQGAIEQVMAWQHCPIGAIVRIKKIGQKSTI
ncbi:hypothetical protein [Chryseobacterium elymi]|uniref:hypothetical protein n=1 Tax=Chryseobacterium elymi TaxID=395936 RepID=UPI001300551E|nr:hypothetical protein [Chryseobacterium elymi]